MIWHLHSQAWNINHELSSCCGCYGQRRGADAKILGNLQSLGSPKKMQLESFHIVWYCSGHFLSLSSWWRHQMETFSALLALCAGKSPVPVNSPHKGQWCGALMFSLICARINNWVNNREAGDLRCHRGHYDVNVMWWLSARLQYLQWRYCSLVLSHRSVGIIFGQFMMVYVPTDLNMCWSSVM